MLNLTAKERIIVPVDTSDIDQAIALVSSLKPYVGMFKFGLELINSIIVQIITSNSLSSSTKRVQILFEIVEGQLFWDGKWADISNTVGKAAKTLQPIKPMFINLHASSGKEAIKSAVENKGSSKVLGVTVLTSIDSEECFSIFGSAPSNKVMQFAKNLSVYGADGIICSPQELTLLRSFDNLIKVTPGVRPLWAAIDDQKRILTPREAVEAGADYLVIGRPITKPPAEIGSPVNAVEKIVEELEAVL